MEAKTVSGAGYKRNELGKCLPLVTPFALHVFPSHRCNFKCGYCLHSLPPDKVKSMGFKKTIMDYEIFEKCIDDSTHFPERFKVLILAGWGEPLAHPQIAKMVELAKQKNIADRIEIVSNGMLLTNNLAKQLIDSGLDRIRISIQGIDSKKCSAVANVPVNFNILVDNIAYFHAHKRKTKIYVKTVENVVPSSSDQDRFRKIFGSISDEIAIEHIIPAILDIDHSKFGNVFNKRHCGGNASSVSVCPFPFYMSVIHPDGNYAPCCSPKRPMTIGSIKTDSITEIWNGDVIKKFRIAHLEGKRGCSSVCAACLRPQYDIQPGDNLDPYSDKLLQLYGAR